MSPISEAIVNPVTQPIPGSAHQQRDVAMIRSRAPQPALDLIDPPLEIIDQLKACLHVTAPRLGEIELGEQLAAGDAEQVGHRDLMPERDQRRVDPVLQRRAVLDQVQPPPRTLALGAQLRRGQPDRRHQIAERQLRQHPRVDLVGLARQRRQPLDPLRVGHQNLPPIPDQLVVHEPRAVHRLHHPAHRLVIHRHPPRQPVQTVAVTRRAEMLDQLPIARDQAHVDALATQVQPNVQHQRLLPSEQDEQDQPAPRRTVSKVGPSFRIAGRVDATARA